MNSEKIKEKIYGTFMKHSGDNGFSFSPDEVGNYFSDIETNYNHLYELSLKKTEELSWNDVIDAKNYKDKVVGLVAEMKNDEKVKSFVKSKNGLLSDIVESAEDMNKSITEMKPTDTTNEVEIAKEVLSKLLDIEKEEKEQFPRSVDALKRIRSQINYQWDGYDYDLLRLLDESKKLFESLYLETKPEFQKQLDSIVKDIKKVYSNISKNIIEHYDEINKIDKEIHSEETFCRIKADTLKKDYPVEENEDDIEAE